MFKKKLFGCQEIVALQTEYEKSLFKVQIKIHPIRENSRLSRNDYRSVRV